MELRGFPGCRDNISRAPACLGPVLEAENQLICLALTITPRNGCSYSHFTDKDTKGSGRDTALPKITEQVSGRTWMGNQF